MQHPNRLHRSAITGHLTDTQQSPTFVVDPDEGRGRRRGPGHTDALAVDEGLRRRRVEPDHPQCPSAASGGNTRAHRASGAIVAISDAVVAPARSNGPTRVRTSRSIAAPQPRAVPRSAARVRMYVPRPHTTRSLAVASPTSSTTTS